MDPKLSNGTRFNTMNIKGMIKPLEPNTEAAEAAIVAFGGIEKIAHFVKKFVGHRFLTTGWRKISDIAARDDRRPRKREGEDGEPLEQRHPSLTETTSAKLEALTDGKLQLTREQAIAMFAALAPKLAPFGISAELKLNTRFNYVTLELGADDLPRAGLSAEAIALAEMLSDDEDALEGAKG